MSSTTRQTLIEEAAKLFASRGIKAVSVRDVTNAANANVASVSYHFGGQAGLIDAVQATYLMPVQEEREKCFESLERGSCIRELLWTWLEPLMTAAENSDLGVDVFLQVNLASLNHSSGIETSLSRRRAEICKNCDQLVAVNMPGLAEGTRRWRLHWAIEMLERSLVRGEDLKMFLGRVPAKIPLEELTEKLLDFAVGGICAPVTAARACEKDAELHTESAGLKPNESSL